MELAITQPFFELQTPDFAWKFVWTVPSKWTPCKEKLAWNPCKKIPWTMELAINQPFFELDNHDFARKFVWTIQKNGHPCKEKSAWKFMQENSMDHGSWN